MIEIRISRGRRLIPLPSEFDCLSTWHNLHKHIQCNKHSFEGKHKTRQHSKQTEENKWKKNNKLGVESDGIFLWHHDKLVQVVYFVY